ncbi:MAG: pentapeptide repeat-containing protein, partial [Desulfobacterales bacterium]|nr:pentapeptide repeat-containing protein [Desulfobacterales bacterium]
MANSEHVAKLKEGVRAWNTWRQANPDIQPDLAESSFVMAELNGMDLRWADLSMSDLRGANMRGADLTGA